METLNPQIEARLHRIGQHILEAARRRWESHPVARHNAESINSLLPLRLYFVEVGRFICSRKMEAGAALYFRDNLAFPDALEVIFEDAAAVMLADDFNALDGEDLRLFLTLKGAVKWIMDNAYYTAVVGQNVLPQRAAQPHTAANQHAEQHDTHDHESPL